MRRPSWRRAGISSTLVVVSCLLLTACGRSAGFDGVRAYRDVVQQCNFGARIPGSEASTKAADYFTHELRQAGWQVEQQAFTYRDVPLRNVIGQKGKGPLVIVGAHYDCRAKADRDHYDQLGAVPGANDGASGAAVLLELARLLNEGRLHNEVWLAFLDAEDQGELNGWPWSVGATHLADSLTRRPEYVVVVDMVGDSDQQLYWEWSSTRWLSERIWALAAQLKYGDYFMPNYKHSVLDDHTPFLQRAIPAVDIIDFDYPYWHTTADTTDKVSAASLERVGRVLETLLESRSG